ncbi:MAG TPA: hypothetical protein VOA87_04590, partial [Thermoanaerobaculia bacterium]|nr:hypothetical protein [Thermoanaerobaculia bacterium]
LHLAVWWSAVLAFYSVVRMTLGRRVALLSALAFGCHPFLLPAVGTDYVDGFGIAYFLLALLALTRAALAPGRWGWLVLAGAMTTALVTANLAYALYLPFLAAHFFVVWTEGEPGTSAPPLAATVLPFAAGALGLFFAFGATSWAGGGYFLYLLPSTAFLSNFISLPSVFPKPMATWIGGATWLVFPALVLLGGMVLVARARAGRLAAPAAIPEGALGASRRFLLFSQLQLVAFAAVMLVCQLGSHSPFLQYFFYASLLLPGAFLAFAGQLARLVASLENRAYLTLVAGVLLCLAIPFTFRLAPERLASVTSAYVLLPLAAGMGMVAVISLGRASLRAGLVLFLSLGLSQLLAWSSSHIDRDFEIYSRDRAGLFLQIDRSVTALERIAPSADFYFWFDAMERDGLLFDSLSATYLVCPRLFGMSFPRILTCKACDDRDLAPGMKLAVLSTRPQAFGEAVAALRGIGLDGRLVGHEEIRGPAPTFDITVIEIE